jgi:hypothetical protein
MTYPVLDHYYSAKQNLIASGYGKEIEWQSALKSEDFTESDLLRETAWVILCSGFREDVVRRHFDFISLCFCDWESARVIVGCGETCVRTAISRFKNPQKLQSIFEAAQMISSSGFLAVKVRIAADPIESLQRFRHVGPITAYHLAKNLGFRVAKNDRHLQRLADFYGFTDADGLCRHVAAKSGDPVSVVDIVLWRFSVLVPKWYERLQTV